MSILLDYLKKQSAMSLRDMLKTIDPNNSLVQDISSLSKMQIVLEKFKNYTRFRASSQDSEKNTPVEPIPDEQLLPQGDYYDAIRNWLCESSNTDNDARDLILIKNCFDIASGLLQTKGDKSEKFDEETEIQRINKSTIEKLDKKIRGMSDRKKRKLIRGVNKEFKGKEAGIAAAGGAAGVTLIAGEAAGFALFTTATSTLHAIGALMGVTFSFSTYTTLTTILGLTFGPIGALGLGAVIGGTAVMNFRGKRKRLLSRLFRNLCLMYEVHHNVENPEESAKKAEELVRGGRQLISDISKESWLTEIKNMTLIQMVRERRLSQSIGDVENKKQKLTSLLERLSELSNKFNDFTPTIYYSLLIQSREYTPLWNEFLELKDELNDRLTRLEYKQKILDKAPPEKPHDGGPPDSEPPAHPPSGGDDSDESKGFDSNKWKALGFIEESEIMQEIFNEDIRKLLDSDRNVYIWGPQGYFKRDIAEAIHDATRQNKGKFIFVNCRMVNPDSFEEFIGNGTPGHFNQAMGGTLLLTGLEKAHFKILLKLTDVYRRKWYEVSENHKIDLKWRTIVLSQYQKELATDDLKAFYDQINLDDFEIPDLHDRQEDIKTYAFYYLEKEANRKDKKLDGISEEALDQILKSIFANKRLQDIKTRMESFVHSSNELTIEKLAHYLKRKHLFPAHQEEERRNDKRIIKSIELIPLPPEGRSHQNKIVLTYEDGKLSELSPFPNEHFYLIYFLCLERLDDPTSRWLSKEKDIAKTHRKRLEKSIGNKIAIDFAWTRTNSNLPSVVSKIKKKVKNLIKPDGKYFTLTSELRDASSIILQ